MITYDIISGCLDILGLNYDVLDDGRLAVPFLDEDAFPHQIVTFITISDDNVLSFSTYSLDYQPKGDLLELANRHNTRAYSPACFIDKHNNVVMDRCFVIDAEVSPNYLLEDVVKPSVYLPIEAFILFEASDEELSARQSSEE